MKIRGIFGDIIQIPETGNIQITKKDGKVFYISKMDINVMAEILMLQEKETKITDRLRCLLNNH